MKQVIQFLKTDGWLYFSISFFPGIATYLTSDQPGTPRIIAGVLVAALGNGLIALKAFRSKSKESNESS